MRTLFFLLLLLAVNGCDRKPTGPDFTISSYPLHNGDHWTYLWEISVEPLDDMPLPASVPSYQSSIVDVYVEKDTVLFDTAFVKKVVAVSGEIVSVQYMYTDADGLKTLAYSNAGIAAFAKKSTRPFPCFPIPRLTQLMFDPPVDGTEMIYYNDPPRLDLKLPLTSGLSWTYYSSENNAFIIDKSVTAIESVDISGHQYLCFRISFKYVQAPFESSNIRINEWIAREGLIKREEVTDSAVLTDRYGNTDAGKIRLINSMTLTGIHIEP